MPNNNNTLAFYFASSKKSYSAPAVIIIFLERYLLSAGIWDVIRQVPKNKR